MFFWRIRPSQKPAPKPAFESFLRPAPSAVAHDHKIADHRPTESPEPTPRPMTKTKTILIVEDNELNMKLFHDLLDAHGYKTLQTRNGREALALAREHRPDLILMSRSSSLSAIRSPPLMPKARAISRLPASRFAV